MRNWQWLFSVMFDENDTGICIRACQSSSRWGYRVPVVDWPIKFCLTLNGDVSLCLSFLGSLELDTPSQPVNNHHAHSHTPVESKFGLGQLKISVQLKTHYIVCIFFSFSPIQPIEKKKYLSLPFILCELHFPYSSWWTYLHHLGKVYLIWE